MKTAKNEAARSADRLMENPRRPQKSRGKDVKQFYRQKLMLGMMLSLLTVTALFRADLRLNGDGQMLQLDTQELVQIDEITQTEQEQKPPPPPRPPVPVVVPDDVIFEDVELELDATLDLNEEITDLPPPPPSPAAQMEEEEDIEIFIVVEQMPEIIGGAQKVYEYLRYPEIARQAGIEGLVVVQIVVNAQGVPTSPEVVRTGGQVLDEAAVEAVMQLRFVPGKQRGKPVQVRLAIPIRFRLRDAQR
jgi:protein TonB